MISAEVIKISLFASRVKTAWPEIKNNHRDVIHYFYKDFIDIFTDKSVEKTIINFIYNVNIGIAGIIIFDEMVDIFLEHKLITKNNPVIALEISLHMINQKYYKTLNNYDLVKILNPLLKSKNLSHINKIFKVLASRKGWKNNIIILEFYEKILQEMRLIYNSYSILYIPISRFFNNFFSRLSLGFSFSKFKYSNRSDLLSHSMYNVLISCLKSKETRVTLQYSEGLSSGILLYFLWLARQNKRIDTLHVAYIKNSSRKFSESFIIRLCSENLIPLRIRNINEKGIITKYKQEYLTQTKLDILLDLDYPIITAQKWNRNDFVQPLRIFTQDEQLSFAKNYKIPYDKLNES